MQQLAFQMADQSDRRCSAVYKTQQTAHFGSAMKEGDVRSQGGNINPTDLLVTYWVHAKGAICAVERGRGWGGGGWAIRQTQLITSAITSFISILFAVNRCFNIYSHRRVLTIAVCPCCAKDLYHIMKTLVNGLNLTMSVSTAESLEALG